VAVRGHFLEAIRQACSRDGRDPAVVLLARTWACTAGVQDREGLLARFGWERVMDTPNQRSAFIGAASADYLVAADRGDASHRFMFARQTQN